MKHSYYCLTSDLDWASEAVVSRWMKFLGGVGIRPTMFVTHRSEQLKLLEAGNKVEIGLAPNFSPGSPHGAEIAQVLTHCFAIAPNAKSFRAHGYFDSVGVTSLFYERGLRYDSNLCLHLQANLFPLQHASGLVRFPVFWDENVHWSRESGEWNLQKYLPYFQMPGIKVINVRPLSFATNIPGQGFYLRLKGRANALTDQEIDTVKFSGKGVEGFLTDLLHALISRGAKFYTLSDLAGLQAAGQLE